MPDDNDVPEWRRQTFKEKIAENEAALDCMKADIRALENKRYELLEGMNNTSRIMTVLSTEILSEIFMAACADSDDEDHTPRQAWRRIAWSTPRLWSRRYDTQKVLLADWIKRGGICPLELCFKTSCYDHYWQPPSDSFLDFLMTTTHRWTKFNSTLRYSGEPFLTKWNFRSATPQLRTLAISDVIPRPQLGINWSCLIDLHVEFSLNFLPSIEILSFMPSLENLTCRVIGYEADFNPSSVATPDLRQLSSLTVHGHLGPVVNLLNLITTPKLCKLYINFYPNSNITTVQILWTTDIINLIQRSSCKLIELSLDQRNITDEGHMWEMLRKISSLMIFSLHCPPQSFTLSNRTLNRLNFEMGKNSRQECLPNLKTFAYRGDISFDLKAMLRLLVSRRRPTSHIPVEKDPNERSSSSLDDAISTQSKKSEDPFKTLESESDLSINITYQNLSWFQRQDPNDMWDFVKKATAYAADGVSLHLNWEKADDDSDDDESE
ncbi:hypothetical protein CPB84DRAFT_1781965 [Gymnopilus junonius]|uniref:F-box domain-containing protein n=1 Tax=Gymnopilus junonius TaxID=109634 RepID=A0A9P5NNA7_GYMJU|nr:hypothetical protein CPB84DRAFT_1781965 [Gymnopilus junonius]